MPHILYGYRLHGDDGSVSAWRFFDDWQNHLDLKLTLKNNAKLAYSGLDTDLLAWATVRRVAVEMIAYNFDPETKTFTEILPEPSEDLHGA